MCANSRSCTRCSASRRPHAVQEGLEVSVLQLCVCVCAGQRVSRGGRRRTAVQRKQSRSTPPTIITHNPLTQHYCSSLSHTHYQGHLTTLPSAFLLTDGFLFYKRFTPGITGRLVKCIAGAKRIYFHQFLLKIDSGRTNKLMNGPLGAVDGKPVHISWVGLSQTPWLDISSKTTPEAKSKADNV